MGGRRSPAIVAGLVGAGALVAPETARALSLPELTGSSLSSLTVAFGLGAVVGVAAVGAVAGVVTLARRGPAREADVPRIERAAAAPRHFRTSDAPAPAHGAASHSAHGPRAKEPTASDEPAAGRAEHAARDYEDIAENYVRRATFRERMSLRAQGVAATLRARMGAGMMEGVPVIERADGSVGDVGTSWWTQAVGADAIIKDSGFAADATDPESLAIPSDFSATDLERLERASERRAGRIAERVAFVDEGAYPERRTVEDLDQGDDWASALRSLDEKIAASGPAQDPIGFIDSVGGEDTLDEPDNLEPQTAFIPFKVPGGHPGVVDTESYVDYLIEDEFSKNSSTAARRSSRRFLRVLEGGTQPTSRHLADTVSAPSYVGKHFSTPLAAEA